MFDLRFPGQRFEKETWLFHNNFRDYHPSVRRYMQSDPLGLSKSRVENIIASNLFDNSIDIVGSGEDIY